MVLEKTLVFPGGSDSKASACNVRDPGSISGLGRSPGKGNGNLLPYSAWKIPYKVPLVGYSPCGPKESDMTEQLNFLSFLRVLWTVRRANQSILMEISPECIGRTDVEAGPPMLWLPHGKS